MRQINISYAKAEALYREAFRLDTNYTTSKFAAYNEGNSLIDSERSTLNFTVIKTHPAFSNPDNKKQHRGQGLAEYHQKITGRSARMVGKEAQLSKAIGLVCALPKNTIYFDYGLTDQEYEAISSYAESGFEKQHNPVLEQALTKINKHKYTTEEIASIREFFESFLRAWQKNASIRDDDMLFAVVHLDESWPHIHICALPSVEQTITNKLTGEKSTRITFSTSKFNNHTTHYFDNMHTNIIKIMAADGIDASGLLNGSSKKYTFLPADFNRDQRNEAVSMIGTNAVLSNAQITLEKKIDELRQKKDDLNEDIERGHKVIQKGKQIEKQILSQKAALEKKEKELQEKASKIEKSEHVRLSNIVITNLLDIFRRLSSTFANQFKGRNQSALWDNIKSLTIPENTVINNYNYGGKSIEDAFKEAGALDIREATHELCDDESQSEDAEVSAILNALDCEESLDDVVNTTVNIIRDDFQI